MGILQAVALSTQPWSQFVQRDTEEEFMDLPKLWFMEIRPSLGEDKKLSKYGIIGKICVSGLREMLTIAHRIMRKIFREC